MRSPACPGQHRSRWRAASAPKPIGAGSPPGRSGVLAPLLHQCQSKGRESFMLIEFCVQNHRAIREWQTLSMIPIEADDIDRVRRSHSNRNPNNPPSSAPSESCGVITCSLKLRPLESRSLLKMSEFIVIIYCSFPLNIPLPISNDLII